MSERFEFDYSVRLSHRLGSFEVAHGGAHGERIDPVTALAVAERLGGAAPELVREAIRRDAQQAVERAEHARTYAERACEAEQLANEHAAAARELASRLAHVSSVVQS